MNELIFDELKLDFEDHLKRKSQEAKEQCYDQQRKGLDGVKEYALCIQEAKSQLSDKEQKGKFKILHMELASGNPDEFNLV